MIERKKKLIVKTFKQCGLAIAIECNLKTVKFFDMNLIYKTTFINHTVRPMTSLLI